MYNIIRIIIIIPLKVQIYLKIFFMIFYIYYEKQRPY
jgi:hypothetical protein